MAPADVESAIAPNGNGILTETSPLLGQRSGNGNSTETAAGTAKDVVAGKPKVNMSLLFPAVAIGVGTFPTNDFAHMYQGSHAL
jgi:hypothetical protein